MKPTISIPVVAACLLCHLSCSRDGANKPPERAGHTDAAPTNRIDVSSAVRQNLGITFAKVEARPVSQTIRLPGEFELMPDARREYRAMISGRVNLKIKQFEQIAPETLLFTIDSPEWRDLQHDAVEAASRIKLSQAALDVAVAQHRETQQAAEFLRQRLASLEEAQMRNIQLEFECAELQNQLPRLAAEIQAKQVELTEANSHSRSRLRTLAAVSGMSIQALSESVIDNSASESAGVNGTPRWATLEQLPISAGITGVVSMIEVTDGGWVETGGLVMSAANPTALRFRAHALQSDMDRLKNGQRASIVPPRGGQLGAQEAIEANISLGFHGSSDERTIPIYGLPSRTTSWSRSGVSAFLEVYTGESHSAELAIPSSSVVQDGLTSVVFRRDPANPDKVIRMEADLGISDGRWIVVKSGMKAGDEVVLDGAYQLMLASSGSAQKGGHFHADGTFHEGDHK